MRWPLKEQGYYDSKNGLVCLVEPLSRGEPDQGCVISVMIKGELRRMTVNHVGAIVAISADQATDG